MQTTAIRTVANSLPENGVILLTFLISKRYIPYTDLQKKRETARSAGRTLTKRLAPAVLKMLNTTSITLGYGIFVVSLLSDLRTVAWQQSESYFF